MTRRPPIKERAPCFCPDHLALAAELDAHLARIHAGTVTDEDRQRVERMAATVDRAHRPSRRTVGKPW